MAGQRRVQDYQRGTKREEPLDRVLRGAIYGYLTELFGFSLFTLGIGVASKTYSTTGRRVGSLVPDCEFLDRARKGRDEDAGWPLWIRPHDEYDPDWPSESRTRQPPPAAGAARPARPQRAALDAASDRG